MQTTAAAASQPSTGRAPSKAPYRARHGPNMKMVWPRKTLKSDAHQKCLPICRRMSAYLQSSWPTPPLETKLKVRRQPQTATSVHASSRRTPSLGHAGHARARIRTHCTGGQQLQMKSTGHTLPSGRLSSQSSTLTPASAPASMARSAGSGSMVGPQPVSRGSTQQADSSAAGVCAGPRAVSCGFIPGGAAELVWRGRRGHSRNEARRDTDRSISPSGLHRSGASAARLRRRRIGAHPRLRQRGRRLATRARRVRRRPLRRRGVAAHPRGVRRRRRELGRSSTVDLVQVR